MPADLQEEVTTLLNAIRTGDAAAREQLAERIYREPHQMAVGFMRQERADHTLQPTALLHEALAYLLQGESLKHMPNREYLFGAAARAMRRVLVEHARRRATEKRGGGRQRLGLDAVLDYFEEQNLDVLALHEALEQLAALHERQSQVVTLRFLCGLSVPEVAEALGVSVATVEGDWRLARAWLRRKLRGSDL